LGAEKVQRRGSKGTCRKDKKSLINRLNSSILTPV
jgi:hypothetical protein